MEETVAWSVDQSLIWGGGAADDLRRRHRFSAAGMPKGRSGTGKLGMIRDRPPFVRLVMVKVGRGGGREQEVVDERRAAPWSGDSAHNPSTNGQTGVTGSAVLKS